MAHNRLVGPEKALTETSNALFYCSEIGRIKKNYILSTERPVQAVVNYLDVMATTCLRVRITICLGMLSW